MKKVKLGSWDGATCYKAQGFGECRQLNFGEKICLEIRTSVLSKPTGNRWYKGMGDCPWWHHWYPLELFKVSFPVILGNILKPGL